MTKLPNGFTFQDIYCYQHPHESTTFFYIPNAPQPQLDPQGKPILTLWVSDKGAMLQLSVCWEVEVTQLLALKGCITDKFHLEPALIRLSSAPVTVKGVTLALGDGTGNWHELKTVSSSGYYPYVALFNLQLTDTQKTQAVAALHGRQGFVVIKYQMSLAVEIAAEVTISGDVQADIDLLDKDATLLQCLRQIDIALAAERLTITHTGETSLYQQSERLVKEKAAAILQGFVQGKVTATQTSQLTASVSLTDTVEISLERVTDVSSWFPQGKGSDQIRVLPSPTPPREEPPKPTGQTVRLGFAVKDIPMAMIQLTQGEIKQTLRAPDFAPVTFQANAKPLTVKTYYTNGEPFEVTLPFPTTEGWVLTPKNVGLAKVVVDGCEPKKAGCKQARVRVIYRPSGQGTEDERTIYLRGDTWVSSWYVITRSPALGGILEYEWKETAADGGIIRHPMTTTDKSEIKL